MSNLRRPAGHTPMSDEQFKKLSVEEKLALAQAYHQSMRQAAEVAMVEAVKRAFEVPRAENEVTVLEDLAVILMHIDDPIVPPELRVEWEKAHLEVGVMVSLRQPFAAGLQAWRDPKTGAASYMQAGSIIVQQPPPGELYVVCFALGMCSVVNANLSPVEPGPVSEQRAPEELGAPSDGDADEGDEGDEGDEDDEEAPQDESPAT